MIKTLARCERWHLLLDATPLPCYDKPEQQAWRTWATSLAHAAQGRLTDARAAHAEMNEHVKAATATIRCLTVAAIELDATIAARGSDRKRGDERLRKAVAMEAALIYAELPSLPSYPHPVVDGLVATAAALRDYPVAEGAYRKALKREPGCGHAYFGIGAALEAQKKSAEAQTTYTKGGKASDKADEDLPQLRALTTAQR